MGQVTPETIKMVRAARERGEWPPLTAHEIEQLCWTWERYQETQAIHREVTVNLWADLDERGNVVACGPHGGNCGRTFKMFEKMPSAMQGDHRVYLVGKVLVPDK